jgi:RNA polymerase sigma factor (TIGR02999 family)
MYKAVSDLTVIFDRAHAGDPTAAAEILPLVYAELRQLAAAKMAREVPGHTLQPTALVHEAWLRLAGPTQSWNGRSHFFAAAAEAMRRILVENARRKARIRHGERQPHIDIETLDLADSSADEQILAMHDALEKLAARDPTGAELIKLRFFVGFSQAEAARLLGVPERTATRIWSFARAWLYEELKTTNS